MRLICPNCDAEYEVPDSAIPPEGRDVQCSNCGNTWFFDPSQPEEPEPVVDDAPPPAPVTTPEPAQTELSQVEEEQPEPELNQTPVQPRRPEPRPKRTPTRTFTPPADAPPEYPSDDTPPPAAAETNRGQPKRRELQPEVAEVLRQEAEFEASARAREAGLEMQGDLGLDTPALPPVPVADDVAKPADEKGARRDLLPDIDEINSTLRAAGDREGATVSEVPPEVVSQNRRKGFRVGFGLSLCILGALAALYAYAPRLAEAVPALDPSLAQYVDMIDTLRIWLAQRVEAAVAAIQDTTSG